MNDLVQWDPNSGNSLPAYLAEALGDLGTNIPDRQTVPSLSYEGKTWTVVKDGNKTKLQTKNADGDLVPVPVMRAVILNFNANRGRAYYPGTYNPSQTAQPDCWSADGKTPDESCNKKQHATCNGCPMSVKGSKVQDGKEMVACSSHRMIAVAPPDFDPLIGVLRLKIAVTSDYDKEIVEHGWFAFRQYVDFLKSRGVTHTALVVTKIKFDPNTAYPKLLFALDRVLTPTEIAKVKQALADPQVSDLLAEKWTAAGAAGTPADDSDIAPQEGLPASRQIVDADATQRSGLWGLEAAVADGWAQHPASPPHYFKGQEVVLSTELAARYPEPVAAPPPPPPPPAEPAAQPHDPDAAAKADGWADHPASPPHMFRGQEVLTREAVYAKYPAPAGNAGAGTATSAPPPPPAGAGGQTAQTAASPSDGAVPADVAALLDKWGS